MHDISAFMTQLGNQSLVKQLSRQDDNKNRIAEFATLLDEALQSFFVMIPSFHLHLACVLTAIYPVVECAPERPPHAHRNETCQSGTTRRDTGCLANEREGTGGACG
jgi:hypothetical protein